MAELSLARNDLLSPLVTACNLMPEPQDPRKNAGTVALRLRPSGGGDSNSRRCSATSLFGVGRAFKGLRASTASGVRHSHSTRLRCKEPTAESPAVYILRRSRTTTLSSSPGTRQPSQVPMGPNILENRRPSRVLEIGAPWF